MHSSLQNNVPVLHNWPPLFPGEFSLHVGRSGPPSNTWFLGTIRDHIPNGSSVGSSTFAGLKIVTDRQTDRPSYSVAIGYICVVLRCCPIRKVVKVIWHKTASLPQVDGLIILSRWRQCAFPYGHIGATWWIRWNLCFLQPTRVHSPNGKSIGSAILAHLTAGGSSFPQNCSLPCGDLNPHLIHVSLGPPKSSVQMVHPFLQGLLVWQTDQLTDHATRSVTIDRIYVRSMGDVV